MTVYRPFAVLNPRGTKKGCATTSGRGQRQGLRERPEAPRRPKREGKRVQMKVKK